MLYKERVQLIATNNTVKRFMEAVELTDEELLAVQDDYSKIISPLCRLNDFPPLELVKMGKRRNTLRTIFVK